MSDDYWLEIFLIFLFVLVRGFATASEIAVLSFRKNLANQSKAIESKQYEVLNELYNNPEKFLGTLRIISIASVVFASVLAGAYAVAHLTPTLSSFISVHTISGILAILIMAGFVCILFLVFGHLLPKTIAHLHADRIALAVAPIVNILSKVLLHIGQVFKILSNVFLKPFGAQASFSEPSISEEEIKLMIDVGTRTGAIDKTEHRLIKSIFQFTDTTAREVMVPRTNVVALDINSSQADIVRTVVEEGFSRMPIFRGDIDNILGIVYAKDLIAMLEHRELIILQDIIRAAHFVPETKKISEIMLDFQKEKVHLAVVVDEFGGTEGLITLEDILEEIVGEIQDEHDKEENEFEIAPDGSILVDASTDIGDFNRKLGAMLPDGIDYETVGGFLSNITGRILELNETIKYDNIAFTVTKKSERRLQQLRVEIITEDG